MNAYHDTWRHNTMSTEPCFNRTHVHSRARNCRRAELILKYEQRQLSTNPAEEDTEVKFLHALVLAEDSSNDQSDLPGVVNAMKRQLREQVSTNVFTITILLLPLDSVIAPK